MTSSRESNVLDEMSIAETTAVSEEANVTSIFCRGTRPAFQPKAAMTEG